MPSEANKVFACFSSLFLVSIYRQIKMVQEYGDVIPIPLHHCNTKMLRIVMPIYLKCGELSGIIVWQVLTNYIILN